LVPTVSVPPVSPALADARRSRSDRARQIADVLRRQVARGEFGDGTLSGTIPRLPGEADLAAEFNASRNAVRDALAILSAEGLIARVQGTGTVVSAHKAVHGLGDLRGLAETLREHGEIVNEIRTAGLVTPPPAVAERLRPPGPARAPGTGSAPGSGGASGSGREPAPPETVVYIERLRHLNGLPLSLDLTYLTPDVGEPLLERDLAHHDIFELIETLPGPDGGPLRLGGASVTIEAVSADPHTAAVLQAPPGAPLLMVERLTRLADGRPVDLEYIRLRGDRLALHGELLRGPDTD
jgi:GntR family transcriptional regulator